MIVVVGSLNMDLVVRVGRHPEPGETLLGSDYAEHPGGKGANQAVAAARLGARVRLVGRCGDDAFGAALRRALADDGVDLAHLRAADARTGVAFIQVAADGQNSIVVAPGANALLTPEALTPAQFRGADVVLLQLEVPLETALRAAELGRAADAEVILNLAPARSLTAAELHHVTLLLTNENEAAELLACATADVLADPEGAARALLEWVPRAVVTLGAHGAAWAERGADHDRVGAQPGFEVEVVDTTAAGDAFAGALALRLARGEALPEAVRHACAAGALAATRAGAQPSLPRPDGVAALLARGEAAP